ncbi:complex I subunit 4 family protein [Dongshaea marina]|uniref:complex I subunit 4 family protein n=1 Tax=Dongshaea marina TaxID=2047966 RepID=UPI000D3EAC17|nr:NADH-quinone oxidoreductase subunit M [Dongshaea marina]
MLNFLIYFPLIAAALIWLGCRERSELARSLTLATIVIETLVLAGIWIKGLYPLELSMAWVPQLGISYHLRLDGLSLTLATLSALLGIVSVLVSWERIKQWRGFGPLLLATVAGLVGLFEASDLMLFYVFWELMLIPIYFMLCLWGEKNARVAATRFMLVTIAASLLMLLGLIGLYLAHGAQTGTYTFDYQALLQTPIVGEAAPWILATFLLGFGVKIPAFPLHFWAPATYRDSDPGVAILLSGAMANAGAYGLMRFCVPLFPDAVASFAPYGMALGAIGTLYAALLAIRQTNLRSVIAYSSISHMNVVVLAIFAWQLQAINGAVLQLLAHGLSVAGLFAIAGMLADRGRFGPMSEMGGLFKQMPKLGIVFLVYIVATIGMPGLANFSGEVLILAGAFSRSMLWGTVGSITIALSVIYCMRVYGRSMLGPESNSRAVFNDLCSREKAVSAILIIALFWIGLAPNGIVHTIGASMHTLMTIKL